MLPDISHGGSAHGHKPVSEREIKREMGRRTGRLDYPALRGVDLEIGAGELVAVVGPSGSGKTTILNPVTGIDRPTTGTVTVGGRRIDTMTEEELAVWRGGHVDPRPGRHGLADRDPARLPARPVPGLDG